MTAIPSHFIAKQTAADTNPEISFHTATPSKLIPRGMKIFYFYYPIIVLNSNTYSGETIMLEEMKIKSFLLLNGLTAALFEDVSGSVS
jgi:hypothetical protein